MPAKAVAGSRPERSRGSRRSSRLTLSWLPSGAAHVSRVGPEQSGGDGRSATEQHVRCVEAGPVGQDDLGAAVGERFDRGDDGARTEVGAGGARDPDELVGDAAHPAHGDPPLARAVADQVVEEAPVLHEGRVGRRRERPDDPVGQHDPTDRVVGERVLEDLADRPLDEVAPQLGRHGRSQVRSPGERPGQRRGDDGGELAHPVVEVGPRRVRGVVPGQGGERRPGGRPVGRLDEQVAVRGGRAGRDPPRPQLEVEPEVADEGARQQRDEVGVARDPGVEAAEQPRPGHGTAELLAGLEHDDPAPGLREVRRGDQGVVPAADDDDVGVRHRVPRTAARRWARSASISGRGSGASSSPRARPRRWSARAGFRARTGPCG